MKKKIKLDLGFGEELNCNNLVLAVVSDWKGEAKFAIRAFTSATPESMKPGVYPTPWAEYKTLPVIELPPTGSTISYVTFERCRGEEIPLHDMALFICEQRAKLTHVVGAECFADIDRRICNVMKKYA